MASESELWLAMAPVAGNYLHGIRPSTGWSRLRGNELFLELPYIGREEIHVDWLLKKIEIKRCL
jgi:hypothetical protein